MEHKGIHILACARKHGLTDSDIRNAIDFAWAARYRNFGLPVHIALAGPDGKGRPIELLAALQDDGTLIVYHAMRLTGKMARELGLM